MNTRICTTPIEFSALIEYWLGELDDSASERIDEHILGCGPCSARLAEIVALGSGIRDATGKGEVRAFITADFVKRLGDRGLSVREYRVPCNGSVNCSVAPEDDLVVAHLEAPLAGVHRVDVISRFEDHPPEVIRDIPFDAASGEIVITPKIANLRVTAPHRYRLRLVAVDGAVERVLGDYTFNHSPWGATGA